MYIPTTTHVTPLATIRRERLLPQPGFVLVDNGERVEASTVVAKSETFAKHYYFDLLQKLDVTLAEVQKYTRVQAGVIVEKNEIMAVRPTLLGMGKRDVKAPAKGTVVEVRDGKILFAATGPDLELKAGYPGVISSVNPEWGVMLEAPGALIQGAWGNGRQEYGLMKMLVNDPSQPLPVELLDASARGTIIVAGTVSDAALKACENAKIRGLIVGSLSAAQLRAVRLAKFPVLVVEGFGTQVMSSHAWTLFADHNGRDVFIDARPADRWEGRRPEAIIPLPHPGGTVPLPSDGQALSEGKRVRITRAPYAGAVGTVTMILSRKEVTPSGIQAEAARVDIENQGEAIIPLANLEIYE
jgi:hypothetical protein